MGGAALHHRTRGLHGRRDPHAPGRTHRAAHLVAALFLAALLGCGSKPPPRDPAEEAIAKAARWLWSKQGADGGWSSATYGLLRGGSSLTPFVLLALLERPADPDAVKRALDFIAKHTDAAGAVGRSDPSLEDYPCYATSLAVRALRRAGRTEGVEKMLAWLRGQQFSDDLGWKPDDAAYGAWGMGGEPHRPPLAGHLDLSMTRHVLEAFDARDAACARAVHYLRRCQNPDGGFLFSTVVLDANKAGAGRSYGTTTADGILALLATGVSADDPRVQSALRWLVEHHRVDRVPGFPDDAPQRWTDAMIHYYFAASAEVFRRLGVREAPGGRDWRRDLVDALVRTQRDDGSWANSNFLMKEDDPLIATRFALSALLSARANP